MPNLSPAQAAKSQNKDVVQQSRRESPGNPTSNNSSVQNSKRKADDSLDGPSRKALKSKGGQDTTRDSTLPIPQSPTRNTKSPVAARSKTQNFPYRGTSKATPTAARLTPLISEAQKAPKKGSYAEIMARASANKDKPPAVGTISHKPKDRIAVSHKKELKLKRGLKEKKLSIKGESRPRSSDSNGSMPASLGKKSVPLGYQGTAKAKLQPTYKGTMKPVSSATEKTASKARSQNRAQASKTRYNEYAATDDEDLEEQEDEEEEEFYASEESDDMEAGFSDVEQEETIAAKTARKEDEAEAKLEAKLKSEKEERKRRLEQLAKKAKPTRY